MIEVDIGVEDQQLEYIPSIQYPVKFKKSYTKLQALINSSNKINTMTPTYMAVLGLRVCHTDIRA